MTAIHCTAMSSTVTVDDCLKTVLHFRQGVALCFSAQVRLMKESIALVTRKDKCHRYEQPTKIYYFMWVYIGTLFTIYVKSEVIDRMF
jgi:hypothetical protein